MSTTINADFPEHRKKQLLELFGPEQLRRFIADFQTFDELPRCAENGQPVDVIGEFLVVSDGTLAAERKTMEALIAMAEMAKASLGLVVPQPAPAPHVPKPAVGPKMPVVTAPVEEDDPLLAAMVAQEADGSTMDPPKEETKVRTGVQETLTAQGTRLALP
jgi:hypothetical protein